TTGYARVSKSTAVILADVAPVGPDYLPGHAHADTLSFELSIRGNRVLVNGGTSVYGGNPARRMLERSTCFHNTLEIDGQNSSEMWAEFRVARRAQVFDVSHGTDGDTHWLEASHDGYRRINGPIHTRNWALAPNSLTIRDTLDRPANSAIARFRLGPGFSATPDAITGPQKMSIATTGGVLTIEEGTWSPEFGRVVPCEVLTLTMTGQTANLALTWET
ncbi:MAG: heparinase II/III-family protein, partial [Pseudomonadota bacterium]